MLVVDVYARGQGHEASERGQQGGDAGQIRRCGEQSEVKKQELLGTPLRAQLRATNQERDLEYISPWKAGRMAAA
jgi:hypothetical protein